MCEECCGCDTTDEGALPELVIEMRNQGVLEQVVANLPLEIAQEIRMVAGFEGIYV